MQILIAYNSNYKYQSSFNLQIIQDLIENNCTSTSMQGVSMQQKHKLKTRQLRDIH